jgi:hypothetical protein
VARELMEELLEVHHRDLPNFFHHT